MKGIAREVCMLMKKALLLSSILLIILVCPGFAIDVIQFKSGMVVEGKITKDDGVQIFVDLPSGKNISYFKILISQIEPGNIYHNQLADQWYEKKEYEKALKDYNKALETQPQDEKALSRVAEIEDWFKSQKADKEAQKSSLDAALLYSKAMANYRDGNYALSAEQLKKVLLINPSDEDARVYLDEVQAKAEAKEARQIEAERERLALAKQQQEFTDKSFREKQAQEASMVPGTPQVAPNRPPSIPASDFQIELKGIRGTGESAEATFHVISGTQDRDLIIKERESDRVGDYRIKVNYIEETKNEAEIEVIKMGASQGQQMTLTITH